MASTKIISDPNALLLYRVGPVLCCSPTMNIESVVIPQDMVRPPGGSRLKPGVFKHVSGIVTLIDLRVAFGVIKDSSYKDGRVIIVRLEDEHPGFWVDEIIDVIEMPKTGWSQVPALIPRDVFERTLLLDEKIRLYCDFDRLSQYKEVGYLRSFIEKLELADKKDNVTVESDVEAAVENNLEKDLRELVSDRSIDVDSKNKNTDDNFRKSEQTKHKKYEQETIVDSKLELQNKADQKTGHVIDHVDEVKKEPKNDFNSSLVSSTQLDKDKYKSKDKNNDSYYEKRSRVINDEGRLYKENLHQASHHDRYQDDDDGMGRLLGAAVVITIILLIAVFYLLDNGERKSNEDLYVQELTQNQLESSASSDIKDNGKQTAADLVNEQSEVSGLSTIAKVESNDVIISNIKESSTDTEILGPGLVDIEKDDQGYVITINQADIEDASEPFLAAAESDRDFALGDKKVPVKEKMNQGQLTYEKQADSAESGTMARLVIESDVEKINDKMIGTVEPDGLSEDKTVEITREYIHVVVKGDTLWHIAKRYVNNPFRYPELARLSNIKNPDLIYPGDRVKILIVRIIN